MTPIHLLLRSILSKVDQGTLTLSSLLKRITNDVESLCVFTHLKEYLCRTRIIRGTESYLLVSFVKPHKRVSRDNISRWVKISLDTAGIDTILCIKLVLLGST